MRDRELPQELGIAGAVILAIGPAVALGYRLITGLSPWPYVVLAEVAGLGWGRWSLRLPRRGLAGDQGDVGGEAAPEPS